MSTTKPSAAPAGVVDTTRSASPSRADASSHGWTSGGGTPSRAATSDISVAAASRRRAYTVTTAPIGASAANADAAVAPPPSSIAEPTDPTPSRCKADTRPGTSVLVPYQAPSTPPNKTVLAAPTSAATRSVRASSGITARLSGIVSEAPANPRASSVRNVSANCSSVHSTAS